MPRPVAGAQPSTALMASAVRMPGTTSRVYQRPADWQAQAWHFYDTIGELRYAANWIGNVLSRATLFAAVRGPRGAISPALPSSPATMAMADLFDGPDGQAQMLAAIGLHLTIAGECYLVGRDPDPKRDELGAETIWEIVGTQEMRKRGQRWQIDYGDGLSPLELKKSDAIIRIWRPHPRLRIEADSPVRAVLGVLAELEGLTQDVMAQVKSRLAGAGILFLPQGMTFPTPEGMDPASSDADKFMATLAETMTTPLKDPGSASAVVPIVVTAPDEAISLARHLTFWTPLDEHSVELRTEAIRRLALGMDIPPEVLLGTADVNHWGSWQIEESSIKASIEPLLELISNALTVGYLQPFTKEPIDIVGFDTAAIRLRPNRSREALELYDRGELDAETLRRETGFDESSKPKEEEYTNWLLRKVASGSASPDQVGAALAQLGIPGLSIPSAKTPNPAPPPPSLERHPTQAPPPMPSDMAPQAASLHATCEMLVFRALERAGNRLRSLKQTRPACAAADTYLYLGVSPGELDKVLEDAWGAIPRVLSGLPFQQQQTVASALDTYCRSLLVGQREHTMAEMVRHLNTVPLRHLDKP